MTGRMGRTITAIAVFALSQLSAISCFAKAPDRPVTLFTNVNVFDSVNAKLLMNMSVLVGGERIASVQAGQINAPDGANVIDGKGRTLIPGLIDKHVHIFMSASTRPELEAAKDPATLHANAEVEAKAILMRGFTSVRDLGGPVFGLKRKIDKGEIPGPRIYPSGGMIS